MTDPTPLVTANRDALTEGLRAAGVEVGSVGGQAFREHVADALLASGVVRAVDWLAEDEARKRTAYRAFNSGVAACFDIPGRKTLDAAFMRFWDRENERATPTDPSEA